MHEREWDNRSKYVLLLQQVLFDHGHRVNARSENLPHCRRDLGAKERPRKSVAAAYALECTNIDQRSHDLFEEERIPAGPLRQEARQSGQTWVRAQQGLKKFHETFAG